MFRHSGSENGKVLVEQAERARSLGRADDVYWLFDVAEKKSKLYSFDGKF